MSNHRKQQTAEEVIVSSIKVLAAAIVTVGYYTNANDKTLPESRRRFAANEMDKLIMILKKMCEDSPLFDAAMDAIEEATKSPARN